MLYSVIVPCYNEEAVLRETHRRLSDVMTQMDGDYEIIYVNDGSKDATYDILCSLCKEDKHAKAIMFAKNAGHQNAVTAGLDYAAGDAIVIIDADLQDPPELIPQMAEKWHAGAKVVYGKRKKRDGESAFKKLTAEWYYKLLASLTGGMVPRDTGDFRLVDRQVADVIRGMPEHARFLRGMFAYVGFRQEAVEYDRDKRFAGETHYPLKKMLKLAMDGIFGFSVKPLKLSLYTGLLWTGLGCIALLILLILLCCGVNGGMWWIAALIMLLGGNILVCIGLQGEYTGRIYDETRQRPLYITEKTIGFGEDEDT